jgi:hypothetical protein
MEAQLYIELSKETATRPFRKFFKISFTFCLRNNNLIFKHIHRTLLELGASPNYRDGKNLTPVYLSITKKNDPKVTEALLHDHAVLGTQDTQGWNEVHQVSEWHLRNV